MPNPNANDRAVSVTDGTITITQQNVIYQGTLEEVQAHLADIRNARDIIASAKEAELARIDAEIAEFEGYEAQLTS